MNLEELIKVCRARANDAVLPYLWSDEDWILFLNEAEAEAAERAELLLDISTPAVCQITVTAGVSTYPMHRSILKIQRAKLDLGRSPLMETSIEELDNASNGWESKSGNPGRFFQTSDTTLTLVPTPMAADVLRLRVYRLPIRPMADDNDMPEIAARYHYRMLDWALRCAYLKQDSETLDKAKAAEHEAIFVAAFGERPDANVQRKRRDRRPPVVRMGTW